MDISRAADKRVYFGDDGRCRRYGALAGAVLVLVCLLPLTVFSAAESENAARDSVLPVQAAPDGTLQKRLRAVLDNIEDFQNVKIDVNDGVVRLAGTTSSKEAAEKVAQMVARFEGVIYVDNQIQVETSVQTRVKPAVSRVRQYFKDAVQKLPVIGVALAVLIAFGLISRLVTHWEYPYRRLGVNRLLQNLIRQLLRKGIFLLGVVLAFDILDLTALVGAVLGTVGVLGLALGFAFKDIVENYLAGLLLSIRRPFDLNDLVQIDSNQGRVLRLTSNELILMTLDGNHVRIPNATVFKSIIFNFSINPRRRFDFGVGVGVDVDLVEVQNVGCGVLRQLDGVLAEPAPFMITEELGDYNVLVRFYGWMDQRSADFAKVRGSAIRRVKLALDDAGLDMPEPVQTIRLQRVGAGPSAAATEPEARARSAAGQETKSVDVSPDTQLDEQIREDLSTADEPNLLTE
ncbi:MAG: mechanosensitive ion channel family protein [Desulfobacterales bacterium]